MKMSNKVYLSNNAVEESIRSGVDSFDNCVFSGLNLMPVNLDGLVFSACKFINSSLGSAVKTKFYTCDFSSAKFGRADLRWARAENCTVDKTDFMGAALTMDCWFLGGLKSSRVSDAAIWTWWSTLIDTPLKHLVRAVIPKGCRLLLMKTFQRN